MGQVGAAEPSMPFPSWYLGFVAPDYMDVWLETVDVTDSQLYRLRVFRPKWNSWGHTVESQAAAIARWSLPPRPISRNTGSPMFLVSYDCCRRKDPMGCAILRQRRSLNDFLLGLKPRRWHSSFNRPRADDAYVNPGQGA